MKKYFQYLILGIISIIITFPIYRYGFVYLLDMVMVPNIYLLDFTGSNVSTDIPVIYLVKGFSVIFSTSFVQKIILTVMLFLSGVFMFKLSSKYADRALAFLAGLIYMLNPWTYERFLSGQWYVYFGYAFFPLFILFSLRILRPGRSRGDQVKFVALSALYPIISLHWAFIAALVFAVMFVTRMILFGQVNWRKFSKVVFIGIIVILIVNSFWLFGGFFSKGTYSSIDPTDFTAFNTATDPQFGTFFNVLSLYGFWGTDYTLPKHEFSLWWVITLIYLVLAGIGAYYRAKERDLLSVTLLILFIPVLLVSVGTGHSLTKPIVEWLGNVPLFKGLRETGKLIGLIAFTYAWFIPFGLNKVTEWVSGFSFKNTARYTLYAAMCLLVFLSVNSIFYVVANEVAVNEYPMEWEQAEKKLTEDPSSGKVLILPWWGYIRTPFSNFNLISNPARRYFTNDVVVSEKFESSVPLESKTEMDTKIDDWVVNQRILASDMEYLKEQGITHIMLIEEEDSPKYEFLQQEQRLIKEINSKALKLYKIK